MCRGDREKEKRERERNVTSFPVKPDYIIVSNIKEQSQKWFQHPKQQKRIEKKEWRHKTKTATEIAQIES